MALVVSRANAPELAETHKDFIIETACDAQNTHTEPKHPQCFEIQNAITLRSRTSRSNVGSTMPNDSSDWVYVATYDGCYKKCGGPFRRGDKP
jgi:hypothetical protein